jgi:hypothetical protein
MPVKKLFARILLAPLKKVGKTVLSLVVFDMAQGIYHYAKGWFREPKTRKQEEEIVNDSLWPDFKNGRRW